MESINNFFEKFLNLKKDNDIKLSTVLDTIKKITHLELLKENLEIKGNNIKINCSPVLRNEIFMYQTQIEESLKSQKVFLKLI